MDLGVINRFTLIQGDLDGIKSGLGWSALVGRYCPWDGSQALGRGERTQLLPAAASLVAKESQSRDVSQSPIRPPADAVACVDQLLPAIPQRTSRRQL